MAALTPPDPSASWLGAWSRPADHPGEIALALAGVLLVIAALPGGPRQLISFLGFSGIGDGQRTRRFLVITGLSAALLSIAYVDAYLHGGPRALDAPTYWLQGRALSHGALSWTVPSPVASYRARGLLAAFPDRVSGIFPPGYPLLLAAGFLVGAPMLIGPLLSGGIVVATWFLARELAGPPGETRAASADQAAGLAVGLSVVCAALRQQTADTLPHGAAALAITVALTSTLRGQRARDPKLFAITGLALGWLLSARPMAALAIGGVAVALLLRSGRPWPGVVWWVAAAAPGAALLLAANHAATGHAFVSAAAVYANSVVETAIPASGGSHGLVSAFAEFRRHLMDVANFEPLAIAALLALSNKRRTLAVTCTALVVAGQLAVHAWALHGAVAPPAANLCEILPLEHALLGYGVAAAFPRAFERVATATLGLALGGFAVHASRAHAEMGESDIGHPHFDADVVQDAGVSTGLLFFEDDPGFELAAVPGLDASHGVEAVRLRGDDHDRVVYEMAGRPAARRYVAGARGASIASWSPSGSGASFWRFEAESDWPPMAVSGGSASRLQVDTSCASGASVLALSPAGAREASLTLELPVPVAATAGLTRIWTVTPRIYEMGQPAEGSLDVVVAPAGPPLAHWSWGDEGRGRSCRDLAPAAVELGRAPARAWLVFTARRGEVALDRTLLR
jgi:hypothetical protein